MENRPDINLFYLSFCCSQVFTDMPGGGFEGPGVDVVITGDALVKKCPSVRNRIGEVGGKLAALPQMQVTILLIFCFSFEVCFRSFSCAHSLPF